MGSVLSNVIIILIAACVITGTSVYIYKAKKRGSKCIGCPDCKNCSGYCKSSPNNK